jgi:dihydropyrimidinase
MMTYDLVIKNGTIVTAETTYQADLAIQGERIAAIGQSLTGDQEIDATGKLVTPGAVDVHVHHQMPLPSGVISADDFFTGTRAAALGGTTSIIDFVDAKAEQPLLEALAARQAEAEGRVVIDYGLHMTITPTDIPKLDQVRAVYEAGCASFKLYMAYGFRLKDDELLQALEAVAEVGGLPVVHAENWDVICMLIARNLAAGHTEPPWHPASRPAIMEGEAAGRVIDMARLVGSPLYIFHVSCAEVVERIRVARQQGLPVYGETCPQYLLLTEALYHRPGVSGAQPICAPPLRTVADQLRLWQALARNNLQVISTDHCPFVSADKAKGLADFSRIPGGVPSIESRFALAYSFGVRAGRLSLNRWVDICCTRPARLFGLQRKGLIAVGYDADLVIFDPEPEVTLSTATLHENVDWTPYEGLTVTGWPAVTISRGEVIAKKGQFLGSAGRGRFVKRELEKS